MNGFDPSMPSLGQSNDSAIDESSPSAMSTGRQSGISEAVMDGTNRFSISSSGWHNPFPPHSAGPTNQFAMDYSSPTLNDLGIPPETVSPKSLMAQNPFAETYATPPSMTSVGQPLMAGHSQMTYDLTMPQPQPIPLQTPHDRLY
jgi:hypothetical protein